MQSRETTGVWFLLLLEDVWASVVSVEGFFVEKDHLPNRIARERPPLRQIGKNDPLSRGGRRARRHVAHAATGRGGSPYCHGARRQTANNGNQRSATEQTGMVGPAASLAGGSTVHGGPRRLAPKRQAVHCTGIV